MSHTPFIQDQIDAQLKTIYPTLNLIATNIRSIPDVNMSDLAVYENAIRIATQRIMSEARIESRLHKQAEAFRTNTAGDCPENWALFIVTLDKVVSNIIYDTDQAYIKGKFYPIYDAGYSTLTKEQISDLVLELQLIKTQRIKENNTSSWWSRIGSWFKSKPKTDTTSNASALTTTKESTDAAAA